MAQCFICGRNMTVRRDSLGNEYRIQLCNGVNCQMEAWRRIREAAKRFPKPTNRALAANENVAERRNRLSYEKIRQIQSLRAQGYTYQAIQIKTGVSQATVSKYAKMI